MTTAGKLYGIVGHHIGYSLSPAIYNRLFVDARLAAGYGLFDVAPADLPDFARAGLVPGGTANNKKFRAGMVTFADGLPDWCPPVFFDPQTSGGLLIAVARDKAAALLDDMHRKGLKHAALVGEAVAEPAGGIAVK